jgi:hypothetical protein
MLEIRRQAEAVASEIISKSERTEVDDGGRLDREKAVEELRNAIRAAEADLATLNARIAERNEGAELETIELTTTQGEHDRAVKWKTERLELKQELEKLSEELRDRKGTVQTKESKAFTGRTVLGKVAPLVKKWKGVPGEVTVPEGATVNSLLMDLAAAKAAHDEALRAEQEKVAALIMTNAALEKEVLRSKAALDCAVERFHSGEARLREEIDEVKGKALAEEQRLLAQIAKAKLHVGQARLQKT